METKVENTTKEVALILQEIGQNTPTERAKS